MIIVDYKKKYHSEIIRSCTRALRKGKVVAYPTDTSYGLAVDVTNKAAVKKLYRIKERGFKKPVHVVVPSIHYANKIVRWDKAASKLAKRFLPGPLTMVLPVAEHLGVPLQRLTAGTGFLGLRYPKNQIALDLVKSLGRPITATSANPSGNKSGGYDSYSVEDIIHQFKKKKHKPDIIINVGKLPKIKPSTLVKIGGGQITILRQGPITKKQIEKVISG